MAGATGNTRGLSREYRHLIEDAIEFAGTLLGEVFLYLCWGPSFDRIWSELYRKEEKSDISEKSRRSFSIAKRSSFLKSCPAENVQKVFFEIDPQIIRLLSNIFVERNSRERDRKSRELDKLLEKTEDEVFVEAAYKTLRSISPSQKGTVGRKLIETLDYSSAAKALLYVKDPAPNGPAVIELLVDRYNLSKEVIENKLYDFLRLRNKYIGHAERGQTLDLNSVIEVLNELRELVGLFAGSPSDNVKMAVEGCLGALSRIEQEAFSKERKAATTTAVKTQSQQNNGAVQRKETPITPIFEIMKDAFRIVKATSKEKRTAALKKICCWGVIAFLVGIVYFKIFGVAALDILIWNVLLFASFCFFLLFPALQYVCEKAEIESVKQNPKNMIKQTIIGLSLVILTLLLLVFAVGGIPNLSAKASLKPVNPFKEVTIDVTGAEPYGYVEVINNSENEFLRQITYEVTPNGTLKNGDVVKISVVYDKTAAAEAGVRIRKDSMTYKVEGAGTAIHSFNEIDQVAWERMLSQALDILETNLSTREVDDFKDDLMGDTYCLWKTVTWWSPELERVYFLDNKAGYEYEGKPVNKCCLVFRSFTEATPYGWDPSYNGYAYYSVFYDNLSSDENGATSVEMSMATLGRQAMPSIDKNYTGYISPLKETFTVEEIMVDDLLSMGYSVVIE